MKMTCLTCAKRRKGCDDRRPRCSTCKTSHLRCNYNTPPSVLYFQHEFPGKRGACGETVNTQHATSSAMSPQLDQNNTPSTRYVKRKIVVCQSQIHLQGLGVILIDSAMIMPKLPQHKSPWMTAYSPTFFPRGMTNCPKFRLSMIKF